MKRVTLKSPPHQNFIRAWRDYRNLSQDQLVDRLSEITDGFGKSTLSRIENGKQAYTQPILEGLAWALNCSTTDLLEVDPAVDDAVHDLRKILNAASAADRQRALRVLKEILTPHDSGQSAQ